MAGGAVLLTAMSRVPLLKKPLLAGIRVIAVFEAVKGALVLGAGFGLLGLLHHDVRALAEQLVRFGHLNPASKYPRIFIDAATGMTDGRLWTLAAGAGIYALVRFAEAYGLWRDRAWAEWLALAGAALYVPVEVYHLWRGFDWLKVAVLAVNLVVVAYMAFALHLRALHKNESADSSAPA